MKIVIETWGCVVIFRKIMVLYFTICPWAVIFNIKPWSIQCPTQSNARRSIVQPSSRMTIKLHTGGIVRWLKKSSKETMTRVSICIWFWDGSKLKKTVNSRQKLFEFQHFRAQKSTWSILRGENKAKMSGSNFEPSQNQMHMLARVMVSFDDFLSQLTIPPVWNIFICKNITYII